MNKRLVSAAVSTGLALAGLAASTLPAAAYTQTTSRVQGTGGSGVACRTSPWSSPDCGYGAPEGASLHLVCFVWHGNPVGPNGNTVWWRVQYGGKDFFVADHWLDTPAPLGQTPTWYKGTGCL